MKKKMENEMETGVIQLAFHTTALMHCTHAPRVPMESGMTLETSFLNYPLEASCKPMVFDIELYRVLLRVYWDYMGIIEKKMETTMMGYIRV